MWYYAVGKDKNKVTLEELAEGFRTGAIPENTLVWSKGMTEWKKAIDCPEFEGIFSMPPDMPPDMPSDDEPPPFDDDFGITGNQSFGMNQPMQQPAHFGGQPQQTQLGMQPQQPAYFGQQQPMGNQPQNFGQPQQNFGGQQQQVYVQNQPQNFGGQQQGYIQNQPQQGHMQNQQQQGYVQNQPQQGYVQNQQGYQQGHPQQPYQSGNNNKLYGVLSYLGLWLIPLIAGGGKEDASVRFHIGQGMMLTIFSVAGSIILSLITWGLGLVLRTEATVWGVGTGYYVRSPIVGVISGVMYFGLWGLVIFLLIKGIMNVNNDRLEYIPIIGNKAFYK
jgi:hypothetical protein